MSALHCYVLHERKELFRLQRELGTLHFITEQMHDQHAELAAQTESDAKGSLESLNFGQTVL